MSAGSNLRDKQRGSLRVSRTSIDRSDWDTASGVLSPRRAALIGIGFLIVAVLAAAFSVLNSDRALQQSARALQVREASETVLRLMAEASAAERGYLLSRDAAELRPQAEARRQIPGLLASLRVSVLRDEQRMRLDLLSAQLDKRFDVAATALQQGQAVGTGTSQTLRDVDAADAVARQTLDAFRDQNLQVIESLHRAYDRAAQRQILAVIAAAVAVLLFGAFQLRSTYRSLSDLDASRAQLRAANANLESEVEARTDELSRVNQFFATSLAGTGVTVFSQDRNLVYTWIFNPRLGQREQDVIGKTDADVLPPSTAAEISALKRRVLATGRSISREVRIPNPGGDLWFKMHIDPRISGGDVDGVVCAAIDVTQDKQARERIASLADDLGATVQRFEVALRAANIVVFTQDRDRRFTWISREIFGYPISRVLGLRDTDVLPANVAEQSRLMNAKVLETGLPAEYQFGVTIAGKPRWFRVRAEPLRDGEGKTAGLIGAAIDVTNEHDAHQQLRAVSTELAATVQRFDVALRGAEIGVFTQDRDRRLTFLSHGLGGPGGAIPIGARDEEFLDPEAQRILIPLKEEVLATGEPRTADVCVTAPDGIRWIKVRVEALRATSGEITGLIGCGVNVTAEKLGQDRLRAVTDQLRSTVQRFEIALRGADVTVFTQDRDLRYGWVSHEMLGRSPDQLVGQRDEDVLLPETRQKIINFKQQVLATGEPGQGEFRHPDLFNERWYLVFVEPQRDDSGEITGLVGAAVDVTDRRQRETHIRFLLRELTHRTKNLLAVIQAMARQTLTASTSAPDFEQRFSGRLQGLARSLDLLIDENWQGAAVDELVRSQLSHYKDLVGRRITIEGPEARLEPEAAQNIGLAVHELSTNSAKYGALSVPSGTVSICWEFLPGGDEEPEFRFRWTERGGPPVSPPRRKGFGHAVIERLVARALDGRVVLDFAPEGLSWTLTVPGSYAHPTGGQSRGTRVMDAAAEAPTEWRGEDEA
jgi:PAS domain S-box-containing protein